MVYHSDCFYIDILIFVWIWRRKNWTTGKSETQHPMHTQICELGELCRILDKKYLRTIVWILKLLKKKKKHYFYWCNQILFKLILLYIIIWIIPWCIINIKSCSIIWNYLVGIIYTYKSIALTRNILTTVHKQRGNFPPNTNQLLMLYCSLDNHLFWSSQQCVVGLDKYRKASWK